MIGAIKPSQRARLRILGLCGLQVLVRYSDLLFQSVQLRILEYFPPVAPEPQLVGLSSLPIARLLISWRRCYGRAHVLGADRTTCKQQHTGQTDGRHSLPAVSNICLRSPREGHSAPPVAAGCTTCTLWPNTMESRRFTITRSSP